MKKRYFIKKFFLFLISFLIPLFVAEIYLRIKGFRYLPLEIKILGKNDHRYGLTYGTRYFIYDPYLIWRPKNNHIPFNFQGYRGKEITDKNNGFLIFAFGDSNVLGDLEEDAPHWPGYLQKLFCDKALVINAGVWGYSSLQGLRYVKETLKKFLPNMILISFGANDAHQVLIPDREYTNRSFTKLKLYLFIIKSRTAQLILSVLDKYWLKTKKELKPRVSLKEYKDNLTEIIKLAKQKNIKVILLTRPYIGESNSKDWWKTYAPLYRSATIEVARDNQVPLIDLYLYFKNKERYFKDESHFNRSGHLMAAKIIYHHIKNHIKDCGIR